MIRWEYQVCHVQDGKVTFRGDEWQGEQPLDSEQALDSCPDLEGYLLARGRQGWELVGVAPTAIQQTFEEGGQFSYNVFLKRPLSG